MIKRAYKFFDKLEDRVRARLSRQPIVYSFIGGIAIVLFWRGVWMTADMYPWLTGPMSFLISVAILLVTGLFVSFFITDRIILSGLTKEKKLAEKTKEEVRQETVLLKEIRDEMRTIEHEIQELKNKSH